MSLGRRNFPVTPPEREKGCSFWCAYGRLMFLLPGILLLTSCMTARRGFIGDTTAWETRITREGGASDSLIREVSRVSDGLTLETLRLSRRFPAGHAGLFSAAAMNGLFANLQQQMRCDSILQATVRTDQDPRAVASLLTSAGRYHQIFNPNPRLRRMINRGNMAYGIPRGILDKTHRYLLSPQVRKKGNPWLSDSLPLPASRWALAGYAFCRDGDRINEAGYDIVNWASGLFGNSVGLLNPDIHRPREQQLLDKYLQPLDILVVKSPTHLTDKFIPGFFGHAAIYTGKREDLEKAGWWWLPQVVRHHGTAIVGGSFAEALRRGVRLSTIEEFTDGDYFLILRVTGLDEKSKTEVVERTFRYLTQKYDFNFDVQSPDRLYCTELIFLAFDTIRWKSHHLWERETISPDELVLTALENQQIIPVVLIGPGMEEPFPGEEMIRSLLEE